MNLPKYGKFYFFPICFRYEHLLLNIKTENKWTEQLLLLVSMRCMKYTSEQQQVNKVRGTVPILSKKVNLFTKYFVIASWKNQITYLSVNLGLSLFLM